MFSISNSDLTKKGPIGKTAVCNGCGEEHEVKYGQEILPDGTRKESTRLAYVHCEKTGKGYLVGIDGYRI